MQKYIAVVNPRMDDDEISHLIGKGIAGALFQISHQNYALAAKMIKQVKDLAGKNNRPISIIQDTSEMTDPLDMQFGMKSGVDWVASDKPEHVKMARGLNKLAGVIYKGRNLPKGLKVDSVMAEGFFDPDAQVLGQKDGQIRHIISEHQDQVLLDSLMHFATHAGASAIAVSDLDLARSLSWRRPDQKIIFAPQDRSLAAKGALYWGVHPVFFANNLSSTLLDAKVTHNQERILDARDPKHVTISLLQLA